LERPSKIHAAIAENYAQSAYGRKRSRAAVTSGCSNNESKDVEPDTDYAAIFSGAASVTPLHLDPTHTESLNHLSHWAKTIAAAFQQ